jgi:YD repeat-containing protein
LIVCTYDQLDRLTSTQRGTLDFTDPDHPAITASKYQDWTLDGLGNLSQFDDNGASQTRDVNGPNEITSTTGIATPTYDAAGNITSDGTLKYEYDAWNRQTAVRRVSDNLLVAAYQYDGQNHRVTKTLADGTTTDYVYNQQWQIVEERTQSGSTTTINQYVWGQSYVDAPLVQFHDGNGDGDCDAHRPLAEMVYSAQHRKFGG